MIRTFEFTVRDAWFDDDVFESTIKIDDSKYGLTWEIGGNTYRLDSQNIQDLKEILTQVELPTD